MVTVEKVGLNKVTSYTIDPGIFSLQAASPETLARNAEIERLCTELPPAHTLPPEVTRRARKEGRGLFPPNGPVPEGQWIKIPGIEGGPNLLRLIPYLGEPRGVYVHIHGGGWTLGAPEEFDEQNLRLSRVVNVSVVSVKYRLAPEHPWPAAVDDCEVALRHVLKNARQLFGVEKVAVGGESAGAHLAALALLRLRSEQLSKRVSCAVFVYGCFDLRMTPSMSHWGRRQLILSTPTVEWFIRNFIPRDVCLASPQVSPLLADLSQMPPALFSVGTEDPLLDDTLFMSNRWAASGAEAEVHLYPGGVHAFDCFDLPIGDALHASVAGYLARKMN